MDKTWLKEEVKMTYEELFSYVTQSTILKEVLNENKLAEVGFEIPHIVYIQKNNKSPYMTNMKTSSPINYVKGDATEPIGDGKKFIAHICNDVGGWGRGFVLALSKKWDEPEQEYREWNKTGFCDTELDCQCSTRTKFELGNIQTVVVEEDIVVINMLAQHNCYPTIGKDGEKIQPIRYAALKECLYKLAVLACNNNASVHMPMIGAGLAGGDWTVIEGIINNTLIRMGVETTVYIFEEQ